MPEMNRFDEQLKEAFAQFEPEVTPDFASLQKQLDRQADGGRSELSRRYQAARRVAAASSAIALGLMGWLFLRDEPEVQVEPALEPAAWVKFDGQAGQGMGAVVAAEEAAARTTSSVVISNPEATAAASSASSSKPTAIAARTESAGELTESPSARSAAKPSATAESATSLAEPATPASDERAIGFESSVQEACEGTEVSFKLDGEWTEGSFLWNFGDGAFSSEAEPSHVFDRPGTYDITISVRSHNDGQIRTRTVENMIVVRPRPEAKLNWKLPKALNGKEVLVHLENQTERTSSSTWLIGEEKLNQSQAQLKVPGEYPVHLIASNAYGCQDHEVATLRLGDRIGAGAPSSFSPDGDGRYDTFLPRAAKEAEGAWVLRVFDSAEREVFQTHNALAPWDGRLQSGEVAPRGRYHWTLSMNDRAGNPMLYSDEVRVE